MSTEQPQPEFQRTFTAAEFMHELARVSGEEVSRFAPELAEKPSPSDSAVDEALRANSEGAESLDSELSRQVTQVMECMRDKGRFDEAFNDLETYMFFGLVNSIDIPVTTEMIQYFADNFDQYIDVVTDVHRNVEDFVMGVCLSVMVLKVPEPLDAVSVQEIPIKLKRDVEPESLGMYFQGRRRLKVTGDVGSRLGQDMSEGQIVVDGNATMLTGYHMKGGEIGISGNVGESTGLLAEGGLIIVDGTVGGVAMLKRDSKVNILEGSGTSQRILVNNGVVQ